jgi:hypothetical protein
LARISHKMPYDIRQNYGDCEGFAVVGPDGTIRGCHPSKADAEEQRVALYSVEKADTYTPTSGMQAAAKRAIKWKEDGKATGAGTSVGWTRARQLANKEALSLDTVKRMYSYFSRHEVDKKGKGFYSGPEFPSNGRIMWDAWGGDGGFSWSRKIVERADSKKVWENSIFDLTKYQN